MLLGENTIKRAKGAKGKVIFWRPHMTCVIFVLVSQQHIFGLRLTFTITYELERTYAIND
jgi:hypothetical protein